MLTEIKDPVRLKQGDLLVIPSEANTGKKKKLHLSPSSYGGWGLSIGFTGRSDNTEKGVQDLLSTDNGKPTVLYVYDTASKVYYTDREERYGGLLGGGRRTVKSDVPEVRKAFFMRLPLPGDRNLVRSRYWIEHFGERVAKALSGHVLFRHMAERYSSCCDGCPDQALKDAVDSYAALDNGEGRGTGFWDLVPTGDVGRRADDAMCVDDIGEKFLDGDVFENSYEVKQKDYAVAVGPKFLRNMAKLGARFYRPDGEFLDAVSRQVAETAMMEYANRQTKVLHRVKNFVERLKRDLENVKWRGKSACTITKKVQLRKPEVRKLFKGLV